jgi:lipoyl(octanoyl) transferase
MSAPAAAEKPPAVAPTAIPPDTTRGTSVAASGALVRGAAVSKPRRVDLGLTDCEATWRSMKAFTDARQPDTPDEIWLTEHAPVYTLGLAGRSEHILRVNGIPVLKVDRGGQVTYHGPGQIVAYLLLDLRRMRSGVRLLVRRMESAVIELLATYQVSAYARRDAPGVYVRTSAGEAKIAALGLKVRNGCTYHGLAINHDMNLAPFADIDPCGYAGLAVTQLRDVGVDAPRRLVEQRLIDALVASIYGSEEYAR